MKEGGNFLLINLRLDFDGSLGDDRLKFPNFFQNTATLEIRRYRKNTWKEAFKFSGDLPIGDLSDEPNATLINVYESFIQNRIIKLRKIIAWVGITNYHVARYSHEWNDRTVANLPGGAR